MFGIIVLSVLLFSSLFVYFPKQTAFLVVLFVTYPLAMIRVMVKEQLMWTLAGSILTGMLYVTEIGDWRIVALSAFGLQGLYNTLVYFFLFAPMMWTRYEELNREKEL